MYPIQSFTLHALQAEILEALVVGEQFETIADLLCRRAEELAPGTICSIVGIAHDGKIKPVAAPSLPPSYAQAIDGVAIGPNAGSCGTAAYRGEPVVVEDISTDLLWTDYKDLVLPLGLVACWSSPIKTTDGRVVATFAFYYRTKRGPNAIERSIVHTCLHLCAIAIAHDETRKRNHDLAYYDQLTGLPNRRGFDDLMSDRTISDDPAFGLLLVDIDNLKIANDTMGHVVGDSLIQEVARRFNSIVPSGSCRVGGDEFAVLVDDCRDHADLVEVVEKIEQAMKEPLECGGYTIIPKVTIGGVVYGIDGIDADVLRQNADFALYHAKEINRGSYVLFERGLRTSIAQRMSTINAVDHALNEQRVLPYYQPLVDMSKGTVSGLEALARIRREDDKIVSAGQFQAALSDPNIAYRLTDQMLSQVAKDMRGWLDQGIAIEHVGINLSTADFHRNDLEERLSQAFEGLGVPFNRLLLEVTETVFMSSNDDKVARVIEPLRKKGMLVALDDFGTGYASLTHLINFPVDVVKIDKTFVDRMVSERTSRLIVESLIDLCCKLGMRIVAEGIETEEQANWLRERGCNYGQGYYFARPSDVAGTTRLLRTSMLKQANVVDEEPIRLLA